MSRAAVARPQADEYAEFHKTYISKVPGDDIVQFLHEQLSSTKALLQTIDESTAERKYAEGKWSVKEVIGHIVDTERVLSYRALVFARGDIGPLPGFDQDTWMRYAGFGSYTIQGIAAEFHAVRLSTIALFQNLPAAAWSRRGTANDREITTRAAAFIIAGHAQHHLDILKARYLV